jgi:hypothetical protein
MPVPIFVSYSHQDAGLVKPVVGLLRATKDLVFQDVDGVTPGTKWRPQIEEALGVAHLIVLFWCYHSSRSAEVRKEYESALSTGKDVLPVLLDATPLPKELNEFQWVDFRQFVGLGHRSFKRRLATAAAAVSVLMVGLLALVILPREAPVPNSKYPTPLESVQHDPNKESLSKQRFSKLVRPDSSPPLATKSAPLPSVAPSRPLPTEPPALTPGDATTRPLPPAASPPWLLPWGLIILAAIVLVVMVCLLRWVRRSSIRKKMATTLQEELFRRVTDSA